MRRKKAVLNFPTLSSLKCNIYFPPFGANDVFLKRYVVVRFAIPPNSKQFAMPLHFNPMDPQR